MLRLLALLERHVGLQVLVRERLRERAGLLLLVLVEQPEEPRRPLRVRRDRGQDEAAPVALVLLVPLLSQRGGECELLQVVEVAD